VERTAHIDAVNAVAKALVAHLWPDENTPTAYELTQARIAVCTLIRLGWTPATNQGAP
jgi:hypothetical protein